MIYFLEIDYKIHHNNFLKFATEMQITENYVYINSLILIYKSKFCVFGGRRKSFKCT